MKRTLIKITLCALIGLLGVGIFSFSVGDDRNFQVIKNLDIFNAVYDMPKGDERIRLTTEIVAGIIIEELDKLGMAEGVPKEERFLDAYSRVMSES